MKKFLCRNLIFALTILFPLTVFYYSNKKYLTAYRISNSYSFNEKIKWLPKPEKMKILTIGSSMSLNNISSKEILSGFNTTKYLNLGSWGLKMDDIASLIPLCVQIYKPDIVLCASNIMDFDESDIVFDVNKLKSEFYTKTKVTVFNLFNRYYLFRTCQNRKNYLSNKFYTSLLFDDYGGVALSDSDFNIVDGRWNGKLCYNEINSSTYESLSKISLYLKENNIKLIFVQTPVRQPLHTAEYYEKISQHTNKIKKILERDNHLVIDLSTINYPDSYFVDFAHLNIKGADSLTKIISTTYNETYCRNL